MDQILSRRFRSLWVDRDEPVERQRLKEEYEEEEEEEYEEEEYEEEEEEEYEEEYEHEEEEEEEVEEEYEEYEEEEEEYKEYEEEVEEEYEEYEEEEEEYKEYEEDEEEYEEEEEEETVSTYASAMGSRVKTCGNAMGPMGPNPATTPRVSFLSITNPTTNAASSSQKNYPLGDPGNLKIQVTGVKWIKHYSSENKILLVGEGDFSFSAALTAAFGSATNITATSLDSLDFLVRNYRNAFPNIILLQCYGATVLHEVDATEMANLSAFICRRFDRVVYNFPLAGFFPAQSREVKIRLNQNLVQLFLENAKKMIDINGEIHITHKCNGFFLEWDLVALASRVGLRLKEQVDFDLSDYPGYNTKYGFGGDQNFNCNPSKTYKFVLQNPIKLQDFM